MGWCYIVSTRPWLLPSNFLLRSYLSFPTHHSSSPLILFSSSSQSLIFSLLSSSSYFKLIILLIILILLILLPFSSPSPFPQVSIYVDLKDMAVMRDALRYVALYCAVLWHAMVWRNVLYCILSAISVICFAYGPKDTPDKFRRLTKSQSPPYWLTFIRRVHLLFRRVRFIFAFFISVHSFPLLLFSSLPFRGKDFLLETALSSVPKVARQNKI